MEPTLVIVDIQRDYFADGRMPLTDPEVAADHAAALLDAFRARNLPVVHVHHHGLRQDGSFLVDGTPGVEPWPTLAPRPGEAVFAKHYPNAFRETELASWLRQQGAARLLVVGMMTHMCVDATVRAAADLGWAVDVAGDACATRALRWGNAELAAPAVHGAFLAALHGTYARVRPTRDWLLDLENFRP